MARRELLGVVMCVVVVEPLVLLPQEGKRELERDRSVSVTQENLEPRDQPLSPYGSGMRNGHQSHL
uniref:Uncharacterized protein n=1 Tax=Oryza rufipogon TaxID=4529 RepID=A0A0E0MZY8_ORYRU